MNNEQLHELLYQALETEMGGQQVYETAIKCAQNDELRQEWEKYLDETRNHEQILRGVFEELDLNPDAETPGRTIVRKKAIGLVQAMESALKEGTGPLAELVAAESVTEAEYKDHQNWELIGLVAEEIKDDQQQMAKVLKGAYEQVEEEEDEHFYHTMGWARELWVHSLGLPAVIPPPEEEKSVTTQIGAARAKEGRGEMLREQQ